jgi:aspartokinase
VAEPERLEIFPLKIFRDLTQISLLGIPSRPGATRPLLDLLERHLVPLRFILEGCAGDLSRDLIICIDSKAFTRLQPELKEVEVRMQPREVLVRRRVAVVRMLGPHFDIRPGTSGLLFSTLARAGISVLSNATTITSSLCVLPEDQVKPAIRAISRTFEMPAGKKKH